MAIIDNAQALCVFYGDFAALDTPTNQALAQESEDMRIEEG